MLYFENAKECIESLSGSVDRSSPESEFYYKLSQMIPNKVDVDTLVLAFKIILQEEEREGKNIVPYIAIIYYPIRKFVSNEFAHEFRKKYNALVLGLTQEDLPDVDYGYNEVYKDVIDISNKDRNEVLAALYNASTPIGMGFAQYNPMTWTKEIASMYFEQYGKLDSDGVITINWIMGRPLNIKFENNLVYVAGYNNDNELGLAQRAISTCPNVIKKQKI